ncbi:shikimate kinase [Ruicaihuangia caeni]|uniref:Shikimate kinase n=1 Tax=Ruicaihuangia caeni TaxID=3042517 RepID=A0AAW6T413_9MICO|nr:shikimate kinase [Klugiella sp. YN-L-19]MDI2098064.1 shikimate kinase [Klugiella sp. YN-L-19]
MSSPVSEAAPRPIAIFIGAPSSGKSKIGKRVARLLGSDFVDTDKRIVAVHGPITEIFASMGEPHFRELEREEVARALIEHAVVSVGGGAVMHPATRAALAGHRVVLLTTTAEAVASRLKGGNRPLLKDGGVEAWKRLVEQRTPVYESLATRSWDTSKRPIDEIAAEIAEWLQQEETR